MAFTCAREESHDHSNCCSHFTNPSVHQSLSEIDFDRGIWPAALNGEREEVERHLQKGVHPDVTDASGYTALHYASRNGHLKVCEILLASRADANVRTKSGGVTPLHRAAYKGHTDIIKLLLKHGADPKVIDSDGKIALHKAVEENHVEAARLIVKACPNCVSIRDYKDKLPIHYMKDNSSIKSLLTS